MTLPQNNKKTTARLLLVDDDIEYRRSVEIFLKKNNCHVVTAAGVKGAVNILKSQKIDLILADAKINDGSGTDLIVLAKEQNERIGVIILTSGGTIQDAVQAMRRGADDYFAKPVDNDELLIHVEQVLASRMTRPESTAMHEEIAWKYSFDSLIGISDHMTRLKSLAMRVAGTDISFLISGDLGTGKELLARAIHYHSKRRKKKFVPVVCSSIPDILLESQFFGHVKGAFPDAYMNHKGLFEIADGGTVFLDEIGDLSPALQAKILHVAQESEIRPVGASDYKKINVRIIAATGKNLTAMLAERTFREDLFYRLNLLPLNIPALADRVDDIPVLVDYFIKREKIERNNDKLSIAPEAMEKLKKHNWPGNVRELENTIKRAVALSQSGQIKPADILFITSENNRISKIVFSHQTDEIESGTLEESLRKRIESTLYANSWNLTRSAVKLGIGRTTLWRKIKKYNISREEETSKRTME